MLQRSITFAAIFILLISVNSYAVTSATGGISETTFSTNAETFSVTLDWATEVDGTWSFSDANWNAAVSITDNGFGSWLVDWEFQHLAALHADEVSGPLAEVGTSFAYNQYGMVANDTSTFTHPWSDHVDHWTFQFDRDNVNPADSSISFSVGHMAPEPISTTLFIVGAGTLGLRRFRKQ